MVTGLGTGRGVEESLRGALPGHGEEGRGEADVGGHAVAEAPWSGAEWAVALRFDNPRAPVLVLVLG